MKRFIPLVSGIALLALFVAYTFSGIILSGPLDKLVQLLLLVPSVIFISLFYSGLTEKDLAKILRHFIMRPSSAIFCAAAMMLLMIFSIWMALDPMEGIPKGGDEVAYFFQSKVFASGNLSAPLPEVSNPRNYFPFRHFIFRNGMWFIMYTPTHALVMAPFTLLRISWLLGPLEGILILLGLYLLVKTWSGELYARVCVILLLLSPFFLLMIPTYMAHNSNLLFVTWGLLLLSKGWKEDRLLLSIISGFLLGTAFTTKPYPIIAWGLSLAVFLILRGKKGIRHLICMAAGSLLPAAYLFSTNWHYTGNPLHTTYELARGGSLVGFGKGSAYYPVYGNFDHTVFKGIKNIVHQFIIGSIALFGWPGISGVPILIAFWKVIRKPTVRWLFIPPAILALLLVAHYAPAIAYGPRHYFTMIPIFIFLSAMGISISIKYLSGKFNQRGSNFAVLVIAGLFCITLFIYLPEEISLRAGPWQAIDREPSRMASEVAEIPAVVFMQADEHGYPNICSGLLLNSPFLTGDIIYCAHQTEESDRAFMELYPDRHYYLFWFDGSESRMEEWSEARTSTLASSDSMRE